MILPNVVNAGVTKAGTTSLWGYLDQHPQVCVGNQKDINRYSPLRFGEPPVAPLAAYAAHFEDCGDRPVRIDISPDYFTGGAQLVGTLDRELPGVRAVVILRDPVARLWSSYTYKRSLGVLPDSATFRSTFEADLAAHQCGHDRAREGQHHRTLSTGFYDLHLAPWFDHLGTDRVHVMFLENLQRDAVHELQRLCGWLGIDRDVVSGFETGVRNPTLQARSHALRRVAQVVNARGDRVLRRVPHLEAQLRRIYARLNARTLEERFTPEDQAMVAELYDPSVRRLRTLLDDHGVTALPAWVDRTPG